MHYLYGSKPAVSRKLVATFSSEQQLLSYVRWATLSEHEGVCKFEQGGSLAGYARWESSTARLTGDDAAAVDHNPSSGML
jgi:hypothetical protein